MEALTTRIFCWRLDHIDYDHALEGPVNNRLSAEVSRTEAWVRGFLSTEISECVAVNVHQPGFFILVIHIKPSFDNRISGATMSLESNNNVSDHTSSSRNAESGSNSKQSSPRHHGSVLLDDGIFQHPPFIDSLNDSDANLSKAGRDDHSAQRSETSKSSCRSASK